MAYSEDFREKALSLYDVLKNKKQVSEILGIRRHTISSWLKLREETGGLKHKAGGIRKEKVNKEKLKEYVKENPDKFLHEIAEEFNCSPSWILELLRKINFTRKKKLQPIKNRT